MTFAFLNNDVENGSIKNAHVYYGFDSFPEATTINEVCSSMPVHSLLFSDSDWNGPWGVDGSTMNGSILILKTTSNRATLLNQYVSSSASNSGLYLYVANWSGAHGLNAWRKISYDIE